MPIVMYKHEYQGGPFFEVFTAQSKESVTGWKLSGSSSIKHTYDKDVKSYIYSLEGNGATTKMTFPKDAKQSLHLVQRYLILQIFIPKSAECSFSFGVSDMGNNKRRIMLSTSYKEISANPLHVQITLGIVNRFRWLNLCFDLCSLVSDTWPGQTFKMLDNISVSAQVKLRRIFTMKHQPHDTTDDDDLYSIMESTNSNVQLDSVPKPHQFAASVDAWTQVINMNKMKHFEWKSKGGDPTQKPGSGLSIDLDSSGGKKPPNGKYHIAFGTKVPTPRSKHKDGSASNRSRQTGDNKSDRSRHGNQLNNSDNRGHEDGNTLTVQPRDRKNSDPGEYQEDPDLLVDKESLRSSHTWTDGADNKESIPFVRPHPPQEPSSHGRRRRPRVKSAGKERTPNIVVSESPSTTNEGDESISDVISVLKQAKFDKSLLPDVEGESTEEEMENMYTFSSKPISAPHEYRGSPNNLVSNKTNTERRKKPKSLSRNKKHQSLSKYDRLSKENVKAQSSTEEDEEEISYLISQSEERHERVNKKTFEAPVPEFIGNSVGSQSKMSISRKALREIPKDDARLSQSKNNKPYDFNKYKMVDMSDSFEAKMLQQLKLEAMNEGDDDEDEQAAKPAAKGTNRIKDDEDHYLHNSDSDSDDTSMDTPKQPPATMAHHYHEEMKLAPNKLRQDFSLSQSNPRDWGNVFSPPIVLPGNVSQKQPPAKPELPPVKKQITEVSIQTVASDTDGEEELDLLYDPCLNCYFDPKNCKYYELV